MIHLAGIHGTELERGFGGRLFRWVTYWHDGVDTRHDPPYHGRKFGGTDE